MRKIDAQSVVIAGGIGAVLRILLAPWFDDPLAVTSITSKAAEGFALGAGVQVALRVTDVS